MIDNIANKHNTRIGVIGLGLMGSRFLRRLNSQGWKVRGWNLSRAATLPLKKYGFAISDTLGDLVHDSDVLLSSLANDEAVRATYLGENGVFANLQSGTTILEMSTISPDLSAILHREARKRGASMMDLPVYAHRLRESGVPVSAMISLETIGFYSDLSNSQKYPPILRFFYPEKGNFIAFVGNSASRSLVRESIRSFREDTQFPSEGIAAPAQWLGIGWSDQWSFWQEGYPGIMVTDTAPFRYPYYHTTQDTIDKIDFDRTARVVEGIRKVIETLANAPKP